MSETPQTTPADHPSSPAPKQPKAKKPIYRRWYAWAAYVVIAIIAITQLTSGGGDATDAETPAADKPAASAPANPAEQPPNPQPAEQAPAPAEKPATPLEKLQKAVDDSSADSPKVSREAPGVYVVNFKVADNFTTGMMRTGLAMDVFDMAENINDSGAQYQKLFFWGEAPLTDAYGNTSDGVVFRATFTRDTIQKINWDNFVSSWDGLEQLADGFVYLHPDLRD